MKCVTIERLSARNDRQGIAEHFEAGAPHPLIVTDAAADWPASGKWNLDFFAARYGGSVGVAPLGFGERLVAGKATLLRAFIEHLDDPYDALPGVWIGAGDKRPSGDELGWSFTWEPFKNDQALFDDISPFPASIPNMTANLPRDVYDVLEQIHGRQLNSIYISRRNTVAPLHRDWHHTFGCLVQFQGRKTVFLLPPGSYERKDEGDFDPEHPDYWLYPEMRDAIAYTDVLEPPEMVVIPPDWLHYTRSEDHSITLSHNFFNETNFAAYRRCLLNDIAKSPDKAELVGKLRGLLETDC